MTINKRNSDFVIYKPSMNKLLKDTIKKEIYKIKE